MTRREAQDEANRIRAKDSITYQKLFWLFIFGGLAGILLEGLWCCFTAGHWETHVTTMWFPLCGIYGLGAAGCYAGCVALRDKHFLLRFAVFCLVGAGVEILCGSVLEFGLNMYAWNYSGGLLNFRSYTDLPMTLLWGLLGTVFGAAVPFLEKLFERMSGKGWRVVSTCLTVFLLFDFALTGACIVRWSQRHEGIEPSNRIEQMIDERYGDELMSERFCEWRFWTPGAEM